MLKIAITGAGGLVGSRVIEILNENFQFIILSHNDFDITDKDQVYQRLKNLNFDLFLHLAAYTNVDLAEKEKELAYKINVDGTKNLFEIVNEKKCKFIYISTDFVFDGKNPPYLEDSIPNPISVYGLTKYKGEEIVKNNGMIVRISYPYRSHFDKKKDFARTIKSFLENKKTLTMVNDCMITPTFIDDIALGLKYLINNYSPEIFHLNGSDSLSPYDTAQLISKMYDLDPSLIKPITYDEYFKDKAKRSRYSIIKSSKNNFQKMRSFEEGLKTIISACF